MRFLGPEFEVENRRGSEELVGFPFVVGIDGDQSGLGVGGALIFGEVRCSALSYRVGVAKDALGSIEDHIARSLGLAWIFQCEGGARSGCPPAWVVEVAVSKLVIGSWAQAGEAMAPKASRLTATQSAIRSFKELTVFPRGGGGRIVVNASA